MAASLGADAVGLIFYPQSPRALSLEQAEQLLKQKPFWLKTIAVLVNPELEWLASLIQRLPVDGLQFHGEESPEFCEAAGLPYIKALPARSEEYLSTESKKYQSAAGLLVDTATSQYGGSGKTFDWAMVPAFLRSRLILAGGLSPDNVQEAVKQVRPMAVDINSGVEERPGIKNHVKMQALVHSLWGIKE